MIFYIEINEPDQPSFKNTPKKLYSYTKSQKNENTGIAPLRSEGTLHSNPSEKANILIKQLQSAFTSEANTNIPDKGPSTHPTMEPIKISMDGVYKLIKNINPSKATGPDTIAGRVLKENIDICTDLLLYYSTNHWKLAKYHLTGTTQMSRLYSKKEINTTQVTIYRPISITCIACKLLEHIFANMMQHLETNNILYELQHGFRAKRSCESQIISLIHELSQNNDKNIQTDLIIMDFAKAFDKVPHKRLLYKMKYFGISEQIINWVKSFLSNRTQTVLLENMTSSKIPVTSGVPQGTVLGPILFLTYINDLPEYIKHSRIRLFADDSMIYRQIKSQSDCLKLQEDLEAAIRWKHDWLMSFHPDKCNIMNITSKRNPIHFYYNMHGHIIESVQHAKCLGVTISTDLKWNTHIQQTAAKANKSLCFIRRNLKVQSQTI